jgi:predicted enzyme related to lactoylglutathione lyase
LDGGFPRTKGSERYWRIEAGELCGGLFPRSAIRLPSQRGANAFVCSFEVENFDATEQTIRQLGGSVVESKFPVTGQSWQGYFMDAEGNNFGISTNRFASSDRDVGTGAVPDCGGA